ncbi:MAG: ornithine cyclodeaminase family protein [Ignavibacteria bacterium]|nr:ornithine cyclodeaminase family protein [Ignavibacteria bacterium]
MVLILTREDLINILQMSDCINAVEKAFAELANGTAVLPLRIGIKPENGLCLYMPAYLKESQALACKVVSVYKDNPVKYKLPTTIGKVLLQNPETGEVVCIMDGGYLTAVRTGAASGVATKYLANKETNKIAGIFGAGVQAKMQLWAVCEVREIKKAIVYDLSEDAVNNFISEMSNKLNIEIEKAYAPEEVLVADIICTATSSSTPIFNGNKLRQGMHINGIGSHSPNARELDTITIKRSLLVGDSTEACFNESGDIIIPLKNGEITQSHFHGELGEIIIGKKPGRTSEDQITLFKSNGLAIQDAATAKLVYDKARELKIGKEIEI